MHILVFICIRLKFIEFSMSFDKIKKRKILKYMKKEKNMNDKNNR